MNRKVYRRPHTQKENLDMKVSASTGNRQSRLFPHVSGACTSSHQNIRTFRWNYKIELISLSAKTMHSITIPQRKKNTNPAYALSLIDCINRPISHQTFKKPSRNLIKKTRPHPKTDKKKQFVRWSRGKTLGLFAASRRRPSRWHVYNTRVVAEQYAEPKRTSEPRQTADFHWNIAAAARLSIMPIGFSRRGGSLSAFAPLFCVRNNGWYVLLKRSHVDFCFLIMGLKLEVAGGRWG